MLIDFTSDGKGGRGAADLSAAAHVEIGCFIEQYEDDLRRDLAGFPACVASAGVSRKSNRPTTAQSLAYSIL